MPFPDPGNPYPMRLPNGEINRQLVHLNRVIDHPNIAVGDFTYASSFEPVADWAARLAPYLYPGAPERLEIGRYGAIAHGARFITDSANHPRRGLSTYPFAIFDHDRLSVYVAQLGALRDTRIGHDVWIGDGAVILPGVTVGHGAIIGANAVVADDVPPYAVVAGNRAKVTRMRFPAAVIQRLLDLAWWDWPDARVAEAIPALAQGDVARLAALAP